MSLYINSEWGFLVDYDEYWQKWLSLYIGEIIKENVSRSKRHGREFNTVEENYQYTSLVYAGFCGYS